MNENTRIFKGGKSNMPIVSAVCPSCGGQLEVDNSKDAGICQFCGNAFITEKAVNNYHIKYEVKADTVIMNSKTSMEDLLERESVYLKISDIPHLEQLYEDMSKLYPKRHEGWWGKIMLLTKGFSDLDADMQRVAKWFGLVCEGAPEDVLPGLEIQYHSYVLMRMKRMLAEKEILLQKADASDAIEQQAFRNSISSTQRAAHSNAFKAALLLAAIIGCAIVVIKLGIELTKPNTGAGSFLFMLGVMIALTVKMVSSDGFSHLFGSRGSINAAKLGYANYQTQHSETRNQAVQTIENLKKQIENYAASHGIST